MGGGGREEEDGRGGSECGKKEERGVKKRECCFTLLPQSLTSCADRYRSTKRDERLDRACACV